jgi:hypothetical protein
VARPRRPQKRNPPRRSTIIDDNTLKALLGLFGLVSTVTLAYIGYLTQRNGKKIEELHLIVNSRLSELLAATGASEFSRGVISARAGEDVRVEQVATTLAEAGTAPPAPAQAPPAAPAPAP